MTRKVALAIAGTLGAAMLSGVVAVALGRGVVGTARAAVVPTPIVRTETRVITIRKRRPAKQTSVQTIVSDPSGSSSAEPEHEDEDDGGAAVDD